MTQRCCVDNQREHLAVEVVVVGIKLELIVEKYNIVVGGYPFPV